MGEQGGVNNKAKFRIEKVKYYSTKLRNSSS